MSTRELKRVNIKKKKSNSPIYFGVNPDTGELLSIESVQRGLACGCVCTSCNTRLEARKGEKRKHHFAHENNKECLYGAEISLYRALFELLRDSAQFYLPDAVLSFNSYKKPEIVREGYLLQLTNIEFYNDSANYPPILLCSADSNQFQIVLNIGNYYNESDYNAFKCAGKENGTAIIVIDVESIDSVCSLDALKPYITEPHHKHWIYNRLVSEYDKRYRDAAVRPATFETRTLCLAQKNRFKNVYSARWEDCVHCQYCYDHRAEKFCLAHSYIDHVSDFRKLLSTRKKVFEQINRIQPIKKIHEYTCPRCGAPMRRRTGPNGVFAGCSNYPQCKGSLPVEQTTEQVIIHKSGRYR